MALQSEAGKMQINLETFYQVGRDNKNLLKLLTKLVVMIKISIKSELICMSYMNGSTGKHTGRVWGSHPERNEKGIREDLQRSQDFGELQER